MNKRCLVFLQVLKPIKWQNLSDKGQNGRNALRTGTGKVYQNLKKQHWCAVDISAEMKRACVN